MRLALATTLVAVSAVACYGVRPVANAGQYIAANQPPKIWLVQGDSSVAMERPQVIGDTVAGFVGGAYREVPLSGVREVRARGFMLGSTIALGAGIVLVGVGGFAAVRRRKGAGS